MLIQTKKTLCFICMYMINNQIQSRHLTFEVTRGVRIPNAAVLRSSMSREQLAQLAAKTEVASYQAGEILHNKQRASGQAYLLLHGEVTLTVRTLGHVMLRRTALPTELFNEDAILRSERPPSTLILAVAKVDSLCTNRECVLVEKMRL